MSEFVAVKSRFPGVSELGVGMEYFPAYTDRQPRLHGVDVVLISIVLNGTGVHSLEELNVMERAGGVSVTHFGQRHAIAAHTPMEIMNLYIDVQHHPLPELPAELQAVLPQFLPLHPRFLHRLNRLVRIEFDDIAQLRALTFGLYHELQGSAAGRAEAVQLWFTLFLMACCRQLLAAGELAGAGVKPGPIEPLERLRRLLDREYSRAHVLDDLAAMVGFSRSYLCRAFKAYTGQGVIDYLIDRRIQAAMLALRRGNVKIVRVAFEAGFTDVAHFNRTFKQRVGVAPSQYRRRILP